MHVANKRYQSEYVGKQFESNALLCGMMKSCLWTKWCMRLCKDRLLLPLIFWIYCLIWLKYLIIFSTWLWKSCSWLKSNTTLSSERWYSHCLNLFDFSRCSSVTSKSSALFSWFTESAWNRKSSSFILKRKVATKNVGLFHTWNLRDQCADVMVATKLFILKTLIQIW